MRVSLAPLLTLALIASSSAPAQLPSATTANKITAAQYTAQLRDAQSLVAACTSTPSSCDPQKLPANADVSATPAFTVQWSWLWDTLLKSKDPHLTNRTELLQAAAARLADEASEAGLSPETTAAIPFRNARATTDKVLSASEFRHVTKNPFWDEVAARFFHWISRMFGGVDSLGRKAPWLGPLIEWSFVALALAALLIWVRRVMVRQRLAIRLQATSSTATWQETSRNWALLATASAKSEDWRDAVHALYWASVAALEARRVWRQNNARTPREYLRLLNVDAPQYRPLRAITLLLERTWYGLAPAARADYDHALAVYQELASQSTSDPRPA